MQTTAAVEAWRDTRGGSAVVRQYLKLLRVLGCCFVEGLFSEDVSQLEANRCSCWYIAFSGFVLSALWTTAVVNIVRFLVDGSIMSEILAIACFIYIVQLTSVVGPAFFNAPTIVRALAKSACFELGNPRRSFEDEAAGREKSSCRPGRRLPEAYERRLRRTYKAVLVFIVCQIAMKIYFLVATFSDLDEAAGVARFTAILAIVSVATVWSGAPAICTTLVGRWLSAHIRLIRANLETVAAQKQHRSSLSGKTHTPLFTSAMLVATRRDLSELRRILRAWNGSLQPGLLAQFSSDSLGMCTAMYILLAGEGHCGRVVAQALVRSAFAGVVLFVATWSSDDVAKQVEKLKYNIDSYVESGLVCPRSRKEFQTFLLSLSSKEFLFTATGFFDLKVSLLSKLAGAVFIHTTILIQMMRLGRGCVGSGVATMKHNDDGIGEEGRNYIASYFY